MASSARATQLRASWRPVELPDTGPTWVVGGVIADSRGFLVFGGDGGRPLVWTSGDGLEWRALALPGAVGFPPFTSPAEGAASADATVLLGGGSTSRCAHPSGYLVWRRAAGADTWDVAPFDEPLFCAGGLAEIAATQHSFAVVGMGTGDQPFAWQSEDGLAWRDAAGGMPQNAPPSVLAAFDGGFIELGRGERTDARVSEDGTRWIAVEAPPVPPAFAAGDTGMSPVALLSTRRGVLAAYEADDAGHDSAWHREADGSWAQVPLEGIVPGDFIAGGVGVDEVAYLFVGRGNAATLWRSNDLMTWRQVAIPTVSRLVGFASFGGRTVLVTSTTDAAGDDHPSVFVLDGLPGD